MGGPETATFDAVLGRSLAVGGLAVMCTKGHGRQGLLPPVLRVGRAWCLCPLIGGCLIYTVAAAGPPSLLTLHHPSWRRGAIFGSSVTVLLP
jgi:hypothetical protein